MELWDIYDENKERTGATMKHNDWNMKPGEFHLTVLGVLMRPDGKYLITRRRMDKEWAAGSAGRRSTCRGRFVGCSDSGNQGRDRSRCDGSRRRLCIFI